jgi:hypothetical protein
MINYNELRFYFYVIYSEAIILILCILDGFLIRNQSYFTNIIIYFRITFNLFIYIYGIFKLVNHSRNRFIFC